MCQAYDAERNFVIACENRQTTEGYKAHFHGLPFSAVPERMWKSEVEAWQHGWGCRESGIVPYHIEWELRRDKNGDTDYSIHATNDMADALLCPGETPAQPACLKRSYRPPKEPEDPHFVERD